MQQSQVAAAHPAFGRRLNYQRTPLRAREIPLSLTGRYAAQTLTLVNLNSSSTDREDVMATTHTGGTAGTRAKSRGKGRDVVGRERVMRAALEMFLQRGYAGTSMKALAEQLGISAPALYWYFPSKEDLYMSVIETAMQDFLTSVRQSITEDDPVLKLGQMVRAHVTWQLQQSDVARAFDLTVNVQALNPDVPADRLEPIVTMESDYVQEFRAVLQQGMDEGVMEIEDVRTTTFAIITLCEYAHTWFNPQGSMSVAAVANRYEGLVRKMVGASGVGKPRKTRRN